MLKIYGNAIQRKPRWFVCLVAIALFFSVQACVHSGGLQGTSDGRSARMVANLIQVPMTRQATDYTCGVAALQSILYYYGKEYREDQLAEKLRADSIRGTRYPKIVEFARSLGFRVDVQIPMTLEDLKKRIDGRNPVIVLIQAWPDSPVDWSTDWKDGHYAIALGYDADNIYFMDPSTLGLYTFIPIPEFLDRWHDADDGTRLNHFGMMITREPAGPIYNPDRIKRMR
jgi:predicted double-glycine peptidase